MVRRGTDEGLENPERPRVLLVHARTRTCALPVRDCIEIMRPLPVEPVAGSSSFVLGLARIRGGPVPVVDLAQLLEVASLPPPAALAPRYVLIRVDQRRVALQVDAVLGVQEMDPGALGALPPLLHRSSEAIIGAVAARDQRFLFVLNAARALPDAALGITRLEEAATSASSLAPGGPPEARR